MSKVIKITKTGRGLYEAEVRREKPRPVAEILKEIANPPADLFKAKSEQSKGGKVVKARAAGQQSKRQC